MFPNSPTSSSLFLPLVSESSFTMCRRCAAYLSSSPPVGESSDILCFQAQECTPPSSSPPASDSCLRCAVFPSSQMHSSLFLPSSEWVLICNMLHFLLE